ncbi:DNA-3-methyladenine glycosylase I [Microbispora sp. H10830]|uniref:DNA-3-methyladenine glycosylase I n=1 Tax=Microbispora sp. H10830 TaxID=2729109 RepID=UPI001C728552
MDQIDRRAHRHCRHRSLQRQRRRPSPADAGIVRHRDKIEAVVNNARRAEVLIDREGSLAAFVWRYEPADSELPEPQTRSTSSESAAGQPRHRSARTHLRLRRVQTLGHPAHRRIRLGTCG